MKHILLFAFVSLSSIFYAQGVFSSNGGGDFSVAGTWTLTSGTDADGIPDADDDVNIVPGDAVTVTGTQACNSLAITDDGSLTEFTVNSGATLNVGGAMTIEDIIDPAEILVTVDGALNIAGTFRVTLAFVDATLEFTVGSSGSVSMNGTSFWRNNESTDLCIFDNGGTFTSTGSFEFRSTSGGEFIIDNTGTFNTTGDFRMRCQDANSILTFNNNGTINCDTDFDLRTRSGAAVTDNVINMNFTGSTVTLAGRVNMLNDGGTITANTLVSSFTYDNATTAQTILSDSRVTYHNLSVTGAKTGTLSANIAAARILGDLTVGSGATFGQGTFTCATTGDFNNSGTATVDGALTVGGNLINSGTINASSSVDANGNFTNSGTYTSTGSNVNLAGNWDNTGGTYTFNIGDIFTFDGTTGAQTITANTDWYNLTINHSGTGISFASGTHNINNIFNIDAGAVTNSAANVVLISNATRTAQMDNIGTGSYTGNMTVQRRIAKSSQTFTSITSPVTGTSLATWQANGVLFSGFPNSDFPSFSFLNCYQYDEPTHGAVKADGWAAATDISNNAGVSNGYKAHYVYMDATVFNLSVTGTPTTGNVTVPLDFTNSGNSAEDGWNLIGNPYPCTIDWELIEASNTGNVLNGYLAYSGEYANFAWYDGALNTGSGGATKDIPHSQGIWVQSLNGVDLSITEAMKNTTDAAFLRSSDPPTHMRIFLTGDMNAFQDEALIFSDASYDNAFEEGDIAKFFTMNPDNAPTLFTKSSDGIDLAFNKVGVNSISIPLSATAGTLAQGTYSLDFAIPTDFMAGGCITLEDLHTGVITDLRADTSYSYVTSDTTTLPRFIIHIVKDYNADITDLTCYGTTDGLVAINGLGISGSTFNLLDDMGNIVSSSIANNDMVTFNNISGGTYEISSNYAGGCGLNTTVPVVVGEPIEVTADFSFAQDTLYLDQGDQLVVNNNSLGTNFAWDFGDGNTSTLSNPTNTYTTAGVYQVMLTSDNDNIGQCSEVTSKNIIVMNNPLSIEDILSDATINTYIRKGNIVVDFDLENDTRVEISLVDMNGKRIVNTTEFVSNSKIDLIGTDLLSNGVYIVNIISVNGNFSKKLVIE